MSTILMSTILDVAAVSKSYGPLAVLKDVSLDVHRGEIFAIIGPNGAGKTTLFKVMTGESLCDGGRVRFDGADVTREPSHRRVRRGMGRTFQVARVFRDFTVRDNIVVAIEARRRNGGERVGPALSMAPAAEVVGEADELIRDIGLDHVRHSQASLLSHGDKKRLEFLIALALRPSILMLDEPTAGMSPSDRIGIAKLIQRIRDERGITVVMTEHDMDIVFSLASRIMVLNYGEVVATGSVADIRADQAVREVYLGKEMYGA
ncbi:ABC transporter ATP-binding protein [Chelatococcus reniformis]|uniref:ABC transporter ATP-binding protein n=1 Tax=Chelatococcus reniformis TaxID=1494448 RepID=A0A916UHM6_9HYPH|nr:ABC transporter ATP-binding protein [Chelatococcus reniformis]GGC72563.1 ABC transporter ATP-binding protein [Chelatococcus reniformis]